MLDVCLLGTSGMLPLPGRWLTSLMTRYNGSSLMIDCGEGTQIAVKQKGWSFNPIDVICFTHYNADHISGLPGLLLTIGNSDRKKPLTLVGPKGLGRRAKAAKAPREQRDVSLLIDIENSIKAAQSKGYEQWAKIHNLKQAAKTMNFLTEHKIEQYADLVSRIEEMSAESGQAADALKNAEKRLADMAVLIKNVSTYQKTKPVYDAYRKARNREKYRAGQEQAIILHEAAARSLKAAGIAKLPNLAALQSEYEALQAQKEALYADYGKLKKKVREYDIIKQNIDSILQADRQPEREKGTERG